MDKSGLNRRKVMSEKCENCRWWETDEEDSSLGECKRYPPVISDFVLKKQEKAGCELEEARWIASIYPFTSDSDRCGEWKAL